MAIVVGIVEDDAVQAEYLRVWIEHWGYEPRVYNSATEFRRNRGPESVDALVLDWVLPDQSGIELLRWLRNLTGPQLPVILLTGKNSEADVVTALAAGADDFVTKPPRTEELRARLGALLRRVGVTADDSMIDDIAPFEIDMRKRRVMLSGEAVELTDREFNLASFFFRRVGRVVSREVLLSQIWNITGDVATRTIDTYISRLRKKLALNGESGWNLSSVYQHGYRLDRI